MLQAALKTGVLAAVVAFYSQPLLVLQPLVGLEQDDDDADALARVVRGLLTLASYGLASIRPSWFWVVAGVAALQICLWGLQLADGRALEMDGLDADAEKSLFLAGAVLCFGMIAAIILFGGTGDAKARFRKRLLAFYAQHNPEKLDEVDELVDKYEFNEELLFTRLHRKYNALAAGSESHAAMKHIDESAFLYEQSEEEDEEGEEEVAFEEADEGAPIAMSIKTAPPAYEERERPAAQLSSGSSESEEGFHVVKKSSREIRTEEEELMGTPPVSPRSAELLAHTRRQSSTLIHDAIAEARRAQQGRIERRIANIASRKGDGYAGH
ncbi:hypothetical protein BBJ28_00001515 [Nothophytophthora sp. Chile5]|nr:hypothetical protein BBJ28_00001515 [Nothophytophthora sp. Chile5]